MALWRSLRLSNRYISQHVLLLLRFYRAQFYYLGLMRIRYEECRKEMRLTYYSVTVSRIIGLWFGFFFTLALLEPYSLMLHLQLVGFTCCLLIQPRGVVEERTRLLNRILHLSPQLYRLCRRKMHLSWSLVFQLLVKFLTFRMFYEGLLGHRAASWKMMYIVLFVVPISFAIWVMDVTSHLIGIVLSLLLKSFEMVNTEMTAIDERLCLEILRSDYQAVRRLQRRLASLQLLHRSYVKVTHQLIKCLSPQLILIVLYDLSTIYTFSSGEWRRILQIGVLVNNLKGLLHTLDELVATSGAPQDTSWMHVAHLLHFEEVLATHGWLGRKDFRWKVQDIDSFGQSVRRCCFQPSLLVLGLVTPNRRLLFRLTFAFCSLLHLHFMWKKSALVVEKEIFIGSEISLKPKN
ncbi:uncharacterized protein LOC108112162 [Drosophila eugracilis]|uniref:uncharacterized protein LOC108112162 n=1 Tax=Drosophila eugracilis TaxID=29029 RepID=UPI001BDAC0D3|nr:uncharacterized protein LOC108112162 [Drosophila eugracilis]